MKKVFFLGMSLVFHAAAAETFFARILLRNALVADGTGKPARIADIAIGEGRILAVGDLRRWHANQEVDLTGKVVVPGFVDLLGHNDILWSKDEQRRAIRRGATFVLTGNCGFSLLDVDRNLRKIEKKKPLLNLGTLVGHGSLRTFVMGNKGGPPSDEEKEKMRSILRAGIEQGAFGLSSGLGYQPGEWSLPEELEELVRELSAYPNAAYYTHLRNYRSRVLEALSEAVGVAMRTGVPVVVQHLLIKLPENWGKVFESLRILERSRAKGHHVWATMYPYDFWGQEVQIPLIQFLYLSSRWLDRKNWKNEEAFFAREEEIRRRLLEYGGPDKVEISGMPKPFFEKWIGLSLEEAARRRGLSPAQAALALIWESRGDVRICYHGLSPKALETQMRAPFMLLASDADGDIPHPRNVGTLARFFSEYVRKKKILRLEEAVERMSRLPAKVLGLSKRGELAAGFWADLLVLDWKKLNDRATPAHPLLPPEGIEGVMVNGRWVWWQNDWSGEEPGMVLRRGSF